MIGTVYIEESNEKIYLWINKILIGVISDVNLIKFLMC